MATLAQQIQQLEQAVRLTEKMVAARRATQAELDKLKEQLENLKNPPKVIQVAQYDDEPVPDLGQPVEKEEYLQLQADLSTEADRLNRRMAELSNQLHQVPPGVACPELVSPILDLKAQIETVWDKKRYLERNKCLPPEPEETRKAPESLPEKFELAYRKRRLIDQRSKLNKKLENPKASPAKRQKWEEELVRASYEIQELDLKLATI